MNSDRDSDNIGQPVNTHSSEQSSRAKRRANGRSRTDASTSVTTPSDDEDRASIRSKARKHRQMKNQESASLKSVSSKEKLPKTVSTRLDPNVPVRTEQHESDSSRIDNDMDSSSNQLGNRGESHGKSSSRKRRTRHREPLKLPAVVDGDTPQTDSRANPSTEAKSLTRNVLDATSPSAYLQGHGTSSGRISKSPDGSLGKLATPVDDKPPLLDKPQSPKLVEERSKETSRKELNKDAKLSRKGSSRKVQSDRVNSSTLNKSLLKSTSVEYSAEDDLNRNPKSKQRKPIQELEPDKPQPNNSNNELSEYPSDQSLKKKKKYAVTSAAGDSIILSIDDIIQKGSTNTLSTPDISIKQSTLDPVTPGLIYYPNSEGFKKTEREILKVSETNVDTSKSFIQWYERIRGWLYSYTQIIYFGICVYTLIYLPTNPAQFQTPQYVPFENTDDPNYWVIENIQFPAFTFVLSYSTMSDSLSYLLQFLGILNVMGCMDKMTNYCKSNQMKTNTILGSLAFICTLN
ncbi:hypothetical protein HDV01_001964 [Terramyces sp. JEL0728]|nr:hypothetical protein HDV01_001964 [Terramyces sp. JEL0728]